MDGAVCVSCWEGGSYQDCSTSNPNLFLCRASNYPMGCANMLMAYCANFGGVAAMESGRHAGWRGRT
jgi:putative hemolysin